MYARTVAAGPSGATTAGVPEGADVAGPADVGGPAGLVGPVGCGDECPRRSANATPATASTATQAATAAARAPLRRGRAASPGRRLAGVTGGGAGGHEVAARGRGSLDQEAAACGFG